MKSSVLCITSLAITSERFKAIKDFLLARPPAFFNETPWLKSMRHRLAKGLHFIEKNQFYGSLFTEVVGCNFPKVMMVGGEKERREQFIMQFFNTSVIWGVGSFYDKFLENTIFKSSAHYEKVMKGLDQSEQIKQAKEWHAIGKSAGMFGLIMPWMFTLPCLRNAFTVWQSGATNFAQMSGLQAYDRKDPKHKEQEKKALHKNLSIFIGANVGGLALGLVGALAARRGMDRAMEGKALSGALKGYQSAVSGFNEHFKSLPFIGSKKPEDSILFKDGQFSNFAGLPLVLSWILPGYLGYLAFIRDPLEAFEAVLGTAVALFSFEAGPKALRAMIQKALTNHPNHPLVQAAIKNFGGVENTGQLSKMLISTTLYGMLPTGLSLLTRPLRAKKGGIQAKEGGATTSSPPPTYADAEPNTSQPDITQDGLTTLFPTFHYASSPNDSTPYPKLYTPNSKQQILPQKNHRGFLPMSKYQCVANHLKALSI
jgi:hypothetical protein